MGTPSYTDGEITFSPPLTHAELKTEGLEPFIDGSRLVRLDVEETEIETDTGRLISKVCRRIVPVDFDGDSDQIYRDLDALRAQLALRLNFDGSLIVFRDCSGLADFYCYRLQISFDGHSVYLSHARVAWG